MYSITTETFDLLPIFVLNSHSNQYSLYKSFSKKQKSLFTFHIDSEEQLLLCQLLVPSFVCPISESAPFWK